MKKLRIYTCGIREQLKRCLLMFKSPVKFIKQEKEVQGVNLTLVLLVFIMFELCRYLSTCHDPILMRLVKCCISIILFIGYTCIVIKVGRGKLDFNRLINHALYMHIIFVVLNIFSQHTFFSLIVYVIGHVYAIMIQIISLKGLFECEMEEIKYIFYLEVGGVILAGINNVMIYVGDYLIYSEKLLHYPLLG